MEQQRWTTETFQNVGLSFLTKETLFDETSPYQRVTVIDTVPYGRMLLLDGSVMTTEKDEFVYHEMITHVPMLSHPNPKRVLVIGGGDGGAVRELLKHPEVESIVLCEIDGMVVDACKKYLPGIAGELDHPKVTVNIGDGIAYIAEEARDFDLIIVDSTDPVGPAEGLFSESFYQNVKKALSPSGIVVAQTESPFVCADLLRDTTAMLRRVFPTVKTYAGFIPTYPSGFWTWTFSSVTQTPALSSDRLTRAREIEKTCRYYNAALHTGCFALPNFAKELVEVPEAVSC